MADDDIEDIDFDDDDVQDDIDYEYSAPPGTPSNKTRRELERRLEMKRLKELLGSADFDEDF